MEQINNNETIRECSNVLGYQVQEIPKLDTSKILLVAEVNPKMSRRSNISRGTSRTTSGGLTVYTTPADKDFYLTHISYGLIKDATCDLASGESSVTGTIEGASQKLINIPVLTLTAQNTFISTDFAMPIKLDRNTAISTSSTAYTAGSKVVSVAIQGYTVDP